MKERFIGISLTIRMSRTFLKFMSLTINLSIKKCPFSKKLSSDHTKSAYGEIFTRSMSNSTNSISQRQLWKIFLPSRILVFRWKCLIRVISVKVILNAKIGSIRNICPVCNNEEEYVEHALFHCGYAKPSWFCSPLRLRSHDNSKGGLVEWWEERLDSPTESFNKDDETKAAIIALWWAIWKVINDVPFNGVLSNPFKICSCAKSVQLPLSSGERWYSSY